MSQQQPEIAPKKSMRTGKYAAIGCGTLAALVVLVLIIAVASGGGSGNTPAPAATSQSTQVAQTTTAPTQTLKWTTTQTFSGNGTKKTAIFTVPDDWKILWECDNTGQNFGVDGVIYVSVYGSDGAPIDPTAASGTCTAGKVTADSTEEHQGGQVYLDINTGLPWTIQVQELK